MTSQLPCKQEGLNHLPTVPAGLLSPLGASQPELMCPHKNFRHAMSVNTSVERGGWGHYRKVVLADYHVPQANISTDVMLCTSLAHTHGFLGCPSSYNLCQADLKVCSAPRGAQLTAGTEGWHHPLCCVQREERRWLPCLQLAGVWSFGVLEVTVAGQAGFEH